MGLDVNDVAWRRSLGLSAAVLALACGGPAEATETGDGESSTSVETGEVSGSESASESGDASSTGGGSEATTGDEGGGETGGEPFVLVVETRLEGDAFVVDTNLPARVDACATLPELGAPCEDLDEDGLVDAWEDVMLDRLRPVQRMDEQEQLFDDPNFVLANVGRVVPFGPANYHAYLMLGYTKDFGSCGVSSHNGDSERVAWRLEDHADGMAGAAIVRAVYTAAHEGTISDGGRIVEGGDMATLTYTSVYDAGEPRWVVFPSADKHASYPTLDACESVSIVPCLDEDCGPDGVGNVADFDRIPDFVNAGEEAAPRVTSLDAIGFPGDEAWADQDFCGGLGGTGCSSPVREKLLNNPF